MTTTMTCVFRVEFGAAIRAGASPRAGMRPSPFVSRCAASHSPPSLSRSSPSRVRIPTGRCRGIAGSVPPVAATGPARCEVVAATQGHRAFSSLPNQGGPDSCAKHFGMILNGQNQISGTPFGRNDRTYQCDWNGSWAESHRATPILEVPEHCVLHWNMAACMMPHVIPRIDQHPTCCFRRSSICSCCLIWFRFSSASCKPPPTDRFFPLSCCCSLRNKVSVKTERSKRKVLPQLSLCSYEPGTLRLSNQRRAPFLGFFLLFFRHAGPPQRVDCLVQTGN